MTNKNSAERRKSIINIGKMIKMREELDTQARTTALTTSCKIEFPKLYAKEAGKKSIDAYVALVFSNTKDRDELAESKAKLTTEEAKLTTEEANSSPNAAKGF